MKKVLSPDMVAHTWANQTQPEARNTGRTLWFEGDSIYSYGRHFCIAKHVTNEKGVKVVLFTTRDYSVTTSSHKNIVRQACRHLNIIYCPDPGAGNHHNFDQFKRGIENALFGLEKARKPEKYIGSANYIFENCKKYAEFFELEIPQDIVKIISSVNDGKYKEYLEAEAERLRIAREEREKREKEQFKKDLAKWRKGKLERLHGQYDYLRVNSKDRIETSQRVEIPKEIARRTYKWILKTIESGGCNGDCEHKILDYFVKEVSKDIVRVGCHNIQMKEIKSMAKKLGW
jgi:hypothetical protein